jgi:hypothetical protein
MFFYPSCGQGIPEIEENDIPGLIINRNDAYDGESLWGYMNGGADIYLEYGFDILRVQEFTGKDENIKLELFKMDDPVSAFGIYSMKTFRCKESEVLTFTDCLNDYQYQFLYGDYYLQIVNETGSGIAKQLMKEIASVLMKKLPKSEMLLPVKFLTDSLNLSLTEIKMIKGELGIQNKASVLTDAMRDLENYQVYYAKRKSDGNMLIYYEIIFDDDATKKRFKEQTLEQRFQVLMESNLNILLKWVK